MYVTVSDDVPIMASMEGFGGCFFQWLTTKNLAAARIVLLFDTKLKLFPTQQNERFAQPTVEGKQVLNIYLSIFST